MSSSQTASRTHVGRVRDHNEDHLGADAGLGVWVVADGMGGHAAGEVASELAVRHILQLMDDGSSAAEAIEQTHDVIRKAPRRGMGSPGMGTTVVLAQLVNDSVRVCWVGDSRAYRYNSDQLTQISRDHSYVQSLVDSGAISPAEADTHPHRHTLSQCLGGAGLASVRVDEVVADLCLGDVVLLCSDGLTEEVPDDEIARVLGEEGDLSGKAQALIDLANANGGSDNVTVTLIEAPSDSPARADRTPTHRIRAVEGEAAPVSEGRRPGRARRVLWVAAVLLTASLAAWFAYHAVEPSEVPGGAPPPASGPEAPF